MYRRFQVIRDGLALRGRAMVEAGRAWTLLGDEIGGIVEAEMGGGGCTYLSHMFLSECSSYEC